MVRGRGGGDSIDAVDLSPWLAAIVESSEDAVLSKALDGTILTWNAAAERLYGYSADEVVGRHVSILTPDDRRGEVDDLLVRMARGERVVDHRTRRVHKDGRTIDVALTVSPVRGDDGTVVGAATVARDIGLDLKLEEARQQAQKLEAIGRLAGGVAHDFNNLLTAILGYGSIALEGAAPGPAHDAVDEIIRAAARAGDLTRRLLAFSRRAPQETTAVDVNAVVSGLESLLRRVLGEDLEIVIDLCSDVPVVQTDPSQVEQIVVNLVANARDALPLGGCVTIETQDCRLDEEYAQAHPGVRPGRYAMLAVTDNGTGMDADTRAHLFEPFFTTKALGLGTGLGLATVYGIVEQAGGHIWFYSEPGHGTVFKIYLPASKRCEVANGARVEPPQAPGGDETILVVEDDEGLLELAATVLEGAGYVVIRTTDPRRALDVVTQQHRSVDLLVTDVVMPFMSGPELARRLADLGHDLPTIFMSGYSSDSAVRNGLLEVVEGYLDKPFSPQLLLERVRAALDRRRSRSVAA